MVAVRTVPSAGTSVYRIKGCATLELTYKGSDIFGIHAFDSLRHGVRLSCLAGVTGEIGIRSANPAAST